MAAMRGLMPRTAATRWSTFRAQEGLNNPEPEVQVKSQLLGHFNRRIAFQKARLSFYFLKKLDYLTLHSHGG